VATDQPAMMMTVPTATQKATGPNRICRPACAMVIPALRLTSCGSWLYPAWRAFHRGCDAVDPIDLPEVDTRPETHLRAVWLIFRKIAAGAAFCGVSPGRKPV
jgi:hypothetical protein